MVGENERAIDFEFLRKLPKYILISVVSQGGLHAYLPKTQFLYSTRPFEIHGHMSGESIKTPFQLFFYRRNFLYILHLNTCIIFSVITYTFIQTLLSISSKDCGSYDNLWLWTREQYHQNQLTLLKIQCLRIFIIVPNALFKQQNTITKYKKQYPINYDIHVLFL